MTDRARELVERLRDADANSVQRCLGSRIFAEAADFIEQSLTPPEGDTVSEGVVERVAVALEREFPECIDEGRMGFILRLARAAIKATALSAIDSENERLREARVAFRTAMKNLERSLRKIGAADTMFELIKAKAAVFRHYEQIHRAKGTPDGDEKAAANAAHADEFERIIAFVEGA